MERMVNFRLLYYLESNVLFDPFQSGFRSQHSTAENVARWIADVRSNQERRNPTVAVFLYLSSAFNEVRRSTVIYKLHAGSAYNGGVGVAAAGPNLRYSARLFESFAVFSASVHAIEKVLGHII